MYPSEELECTDFIEPKCADDNDPTGEVVGSMDEISKDGMCPTAKATIQYIVVE